MSARRKLAAAVLALHLSHMPAAAEVVEANLEVASRTDLGVPATYGDVTVAGNVAVVATEGPACAAAVTVMDVKDAGKPGVVASIALPPGTKAGDLDSLPVDTPGFTGDLLAVALTPCAGGASPAVAYYDLTVPAAPRRLAETAGATSVALAQRGDGRVIGVRTSGAGVDVDDLTDPARPATIGRWRDTATEGGTCAAVAAHDAGEAAVAVLAGGRVYDVDLADPAAPVASGPAVGAGGPVGVLPLGNRTIAVVAEDAACSDAAERGLRVLDLERGVTPDEATALRYPGAHAPGRVVTSGALAYVAWHGAGLRVVDFGEVRPRVVAQFVPAAPDVVGVALLSEHVVVTDATSGLYVLERPDEGGDRATFWSQFLGFLPYLGFAGVLAAMLLVPRMLTSRAAARSGSRVGTPVAVPRRRA